jgi:hypothetical protein
MNFLQKAVGDLRKYPLSGFPRGFLRPHFNFSCLIAGD